MGREATRGEMTYQEAAIEVFKMERSLGLDENAALVKAVEAAVATAGREFMARMRDSLLCAAEYIDADEDSDLNEDGPAALILFAMGLDETLPPELQKEAANADGV